MLQHQLFDRGQHPVRVNPEGAYSGLFVPQQIAGVRTAGPLIPLDAALRIVVRTAGYDVVARCVPLALRQA